MSDYLPEAILFDILTRLPVKSLVAFRSVCKTWRSLISAADFTAAHLRRASLSSPLLLLRHFCLNTKTELFSLHSNDDAFTSLRELKFPFRADSGYFFRVVGCCNGLICLSDDLFGKTYTIIIWNPAIRRYVTIPKPDICFDDYGPYMFALGFGFYPTTNDPKLVRIVYLESSDKNKHWSVPPMAEVYALATGKWKAIGASHVGYHMVEFCWSSAFVNGAVHWIAYSGGMSTCFHNVILVFDMGSEVFKEVELPKNLGDKFPLDLAVVAYGEMISVVHFDTRGSNTGFEVWVMKYYNVSGSWSKQFNIVNPLGGGVAYRVLGFRSTGEVVVENWSGELVSCQPSSIRTLAVNGGYQSFFLGAYTESLVLLDGANGVVSADNVDSVGDSDFETSSMQDATIMRYIYAVGSVNQ